MIVDLCAGEDEGQRRGIVSKASVLGVGDGGVCRFSGLQEALSRVLAGEVNTTGMRRKCADGTTVEPLLDW